MVRRPSLRTTEGAKQKGWSLRVPAFPHKPIAFPSYCLHHAAKLISPLQPHFFGSFSSRKVGRRRGVDTDVPSLWCGGGGGSRHTTAALPGPLLIWSQVRLCRMRNPVVGPLGYGVSTRLVLVSRAPFDRALAVSARCSSPRRVHRGGGAVGPRNRPNRYRSYETSSLISSKSQPYSGGPKAADRSGEVG